MRLRGCHLSDSEEASRIWGSRGRERRWAAHGRDPSVMGAVREALLHVWRGSAHQPCA